MAFSAFILSCSHHSLPLQSFASSPAEILSPSNTSWHSALLWAPGNPLSTLRPCELTPLANQVSESYNICPFEYGLFHLALCLQGSSMSIEASTFPSFLSLKSSSLCVQTALVHPFFHRWTPGWLPPYAVDFNYMHSVQRQEQSYILTRFGDENSPHSARRWGRACTTPGRYHHPLKNIILSS